MSRLLDDDQELETPQRELTLSTGAILAIFLGLILLCAVFFGFGYNLGRRSTTATSAPPVSTASDSESSTNQSTFDNFKPSPISPPSSPAAPASTVTVPTDTTKVDTARTPVAHTTPASARPTPAAPSVVTAPPAAHTPPAASATTPGGAFVVQIAAISSAHKDDADLLVNALHNKGYDVAERTAAQDKLIHIQVGPFATKSEAEAMRERLIIDGYNAIVK